MLKQLLYFFYLLILEFFVQLSGLVINAIAIPFKYRDTDLTNSGASIVYTQYPEHGVWERWRLPKWALWWDNPYDGLTGDKRGWWANECRKSSRSEYDFISMYVWSALRNPANYFSRKITGVDVSDCKIDKVAGSDVVDDTGFSGKSWQYLVAKDGKGKEYIRLFGVIPWSKTRMIYFNIGWKIKLEHNATSPDGREQDRFKGNTFRFSPFKAIG